MNENITAIWSGVRVVRSLVVYVMFSWSLFVLVCHYVVCPSTNKFFVHLCPKNNKEGRNNVMFWGKNIHFSIPPSIYFIKLSHMSTNTVVVLCIFFLHHLNIPTCVTKYMEHVSQREKIHLYTLHVLITSKTTSI